MNILQIATTFEYDSAYTTAYVINAEGLVSMDQLIGMSYTTALSNSQMNELFPMNEENNEQ